MTSNIQIVVLGIFIFFLIAGVIVFSAFSGSNTVDPTKVEVVIWGSLPDGLFTGIKDEINTVNLGTLNFAYRSVEEKDFDQTLIEALAEGQGPDIVLTPESSLFKNQRKFSLIGFDVLSERYYKDTFIEGSEIFLTPSGAYGVPFLADPLIMYWNRDILSSHGIALPPTTWEELIALTPQLSTLADDKTILKSMIAFGDHKNVPFVKQILTALSFQAGGQWVIREGIDGASNLLKGRIDEESTAIQTAFTFFSQFADPLRSLYSWNRSLPNAEDHFLAGNLAFYFAPASEYAVIKQKNPNLNFDVAVLPQPKNGASKKTSGRVYAFSVLSSSLHKEASLGTIITLTNPAIAKRFSEVSGLPPARRDLLSVKPGSALGDVSYTSTLLIRTWLDPNPKATDLAIGDSIDAIVTGMMKPNEAVSGLSGAFDEIIKGNQ